MAWGSTPTAKGQKSFAKGRIRKFATLIDDEHGARHPGEPDNGVEPIDDPNGFTAHMINGTKILCYVFHSGSGYRSSTRYAVVNAKGEVVHNRMYSASEAVAEALGRERTFTIHHSTVQLSLRHVSKRNVLSLAINISAPNPSQKLPHENFVHGNAYTKNKDVIALAIGIMASDQPDAHPLLDMVEEVHPGQLSKAMENLYAEPVAPELVIRKETRFIWEPALTRQIRFVNNLTGEPVEGPDGEWREGW